MNGLRQREPRFESRKLLDLAHGAPCFLLLEGCQSGLYPSVPCHPNALILGRGVGHKTHDCYAISGCVACHKLWDEGMPAQEHFDVWVRAYPKWVLWLWANGLVKVK